jgi:hypothetical protein
MEIQHMPNSWMNMVDTLAVLHQYKSYLDMTSHNDSHRKNMIFYMKDKHLKLVQNNHHNQVNIFDMTLSDNQPIVHQDKT